MSESFAAAPTSVVAGECQSERRRHRSGGSSTSAACAELFRRALGRSDQEAWSAIHATFTPLLHTWAGSQSAIELEDLAQQTWMVFEPAARRLPGLYAGDQIGQVLEYLRSCLKTAILQERRRRRVETTPLDRAREPGGGEVEERAVDRVVLKALIDHAMSRLDELGRLVFHERYLLDDAPSSIFDRHADRFPGGRGDVYHVVQAVLRLLRTDPQIQAYRDDLFPPASGPEGDTSHSIVMGDEGEGPEHMDDLCQLDAALLLDYLSGFASAELRAAVERSPACVAACRRLAEEVGPLLRVLRRAACPDPETLVAYQERRLADTARLVVRSHVDGCPACQEELAILAEIDSRPLFPEPGLVRRLVEALFQPPLAGATALRGGDGLYAAGEITVRISTHMRAGPPASWALRAQLRGADQRKLGDAVDAVVLRRPGAPDTPASRDAAGDFVAEGLEAAVYSVHVTLADQEVVIRELTVGDGR